MAFTTTTRQLFTDLVPAFVKDGTIDIPGVVLFDIEGKDGGSWLVNFQSRTVSEGGLPAGATASAIVRAQARDFMALVEGRMSADDGLLTKRLQLAGDAVALGQLMDVFVKLRAVAGSGS